MWIVLADRRVGAAGSAAVARPRGHSGVRDVDGRDFVSQRGELSQRRATVIEPVGNVVECRVVVAGVETFGSRLLAPVEIRLIRLAGIDSLPLTRVALVRSRLLVHVSVLRCG